MDDPVDDPDPPVIRNPWTHLRRFTAARIALGRAGVSVPTAAQLDFQLAHAQARDAVHAALDAAPLAQALAAQGHDSLLLRSAAADRPQYLQRPDLGRRLDARSAALLRQQPASRRGRDLALVIADGLSARAIEVNALPLLAALLPMLAAQRWMLAPVSIVRQGRVAIGDEIGELLGARALVLLIGERPGLSAPDSMGLYLTWAPRVGLTDARRNCISNVRPAGLGWRAAAETLCHLLAEARRRRLSGVELKDERVAPAPRQLAPPGDAGPD